MEIYVHTRVHYSRGRKVGYCTWGGICVMTPQFCPSAVDGGYLRTAVGAVYANIVQVNQKERKKNMAQRGVPSHYKIHQESRSFHSSTWSESISLLLTFFLCGHARLTRPRSSPAASSLLLPRRRLRFIWAFLPCSLEQRRGASHRLVLCQGRERAELLGF